MIDVEVQKLEELNEVLEFWRIPFRGNPIEGRIECRGRFELSWNESNGVIFLSFTHSTSLDLIDTILRLTQYDGGINLITHDERFYHHRDLSRDFMLPEGVYGISIIEP